MSQQRHSRPTFARAVLAVLGVTGLLLFAVFAFITLTHSVAMANTPLDVIAYWQLNETSAGTYSDSVGGHDATCSGVNCPLPAVGQVAGGQYFNGNDDGANVPDADAFDWGNTDSFSVELWMQGVVGRTCTGTNAPADNEVMFGRREGNMQLWLGCLNTTGQAAFQLKDSNNNGILIESPNSVVDGGWHHLVAVRDGSTNENRLYVDGVLVAMTDTVAYDGTFAASVPLNLGYLNFDATNKFRFEGTLDETAVYSRVLTSDEIAAHYDYGRAGHGYQILPGILIEKSPDQTVSSGGDASFTIHVTNTGDVDLADVRVVDPQVAACDTAIGDLASTASTDYTCQADNVTTSFTNTATVTAGLEIAKEALPGTAPADTLAYWKLNETSPGSYADSVGTHTANCSGVACPAPADDLIDGGQFFNGNVDGANVPGLTGDDPFDWGNSDSFSIELWMEGIPGRTCAGSGAANNEVMFGRTEGGGTMQLWLGCFNTTGQAAFQLKSGTVGGVIKSPATIVDGGWHHLVAVRDGDAGVNYLYVDGTLAAMTDTLTYTGDFASDDPLNIGYLDFNTSTAFELFDGVYLNAATTFNFDGTLDEIAVYDRALSATEIETHYHNGLDSVGYDETAGAAITVADVSVTDSASVVVAEGTILYLPLVFK